MAIANQPTQFMNSQVANQELGGQHYRGEGGLATAGPYHDTLEPFFGPPTKAIDDNPSSHFPHEAWFLPDAYVGRNDYVRETIIQTVVNYNSWMTSEVLPWRQQENPNIAWDSIKFDKTLVDMEPEQGVPRYVTVEREAHTDYMVRRGLALIVNHGFAATPGGQKDFMYKIATIAGAVQETCDQSGLVALLRSKNEYTHHVTDSIRRASDAYDMFQQELWRFGIIQMSERGWYHMDAEAQNVMQLANIDPDTWIVPNRMTSYVAMGQPAETEVYRAGEKVARANLEQGKDRFTTFRGKKVFETRPYQLDVDGRVVDPLNRNRMIGDFFVVPCYGVHQGDRDTPASATRGAGATQAYCCESDRFETFQHDILCKDSQFNRAGHIYTSAIGEVGDPGTKGFLEKVFGGPGACIDPIKFKENKFAIIEWQKTDVVGQVIAFGNVFQSPNLSNYNEIMKFSLSFMPIWFALVCGYEIEVFTDYHRIFLEVLAANAGPFDTTKLQPFLKFFERMYPPTVAPGVAGQALEDMTKFMIFLVDITEEFATNAQLTMTNLPTKFGHFLSSLVGLPILQFGVVLEKFDLALAFCPLDYGGVFDYDLLCIRPFREYTMGTGILLQKGSDLGNTFRGWADFQLTDNIIAKTHIGHFTFWHASVVTNPKCLFLAEDIFCTNYVSGEGKTVLSWEHIDEFKTDPLATMQKYNASIICLPVQMGAVNVGDHRLNLNNPISLTGSLDPITQASSSHSANSQVHIGNYETAARNAEQQVDKMWKAADLVGAPGLQNRPKPAGQPTGVALSSFYNDLFAFGKLNHEVDYENSGSFETAGRLVNTLCFHTMQKHINPLNGRWEVTNLNTGHFGENGIYEGVKKIRCGFLDTFKQMDYQKSMAMGGLNI